MATVKPFLACAHIYFSRMLARNGEAHDTTDDGDGICATRGVRPCGGDDAGSAESRVPESPAGALGEIETPNSGLTAYYPERGSPTMPEHVTDKIADVYEDRGTVNVNAFGKPVTVLIGCDQFVMVDKCFGPLIFATLRIIADFQTNEFVIERQRIDSLEWIGIARIPGQFDHEFNENHPAHREIP